MCVHMHSVRYVCPTLIIGQQKHGNVSMVRVFFQKHVVRRAKRRRNWIYKALMIGVGLSKLVYRCVAWAKCYAARLHGTEISLHLGHITYTL